MTNSRVQKTGTINKNKIEKIIRQLLVELGENPNREGLIGTPKVLLKCTKKFSLDIK